LVGYGAFSYDEIRPAGTSYASSTGVGMIYHIDFNGASSTARVLLRGGSWGDGAGTGAFTLYLTYGATYAAYNGLGFRCAR
jgi:hypothetical protein